MKANTIEEALQRLYRIAANTEAHTDSPRYQFNGVPEALATIEQLVLGSIPDGEVHVSHVCPKDSIPCREYHARGEERHRIRQALKQLMGGE